MKSQSKHEKSAIGSVGARVKLMVKGCCMPARGSKGLEWKYDNNWCMCVTKETEMHCAV